MDFLGPYTPTPAGLPTPAAMATDAELCNVDLKGVQTLQEGKGHHEVARDIEHKQDAE